MSDNSTLADEMIVALRLYGFSESSIHGFDRNSDVFTDLKIVGDNFTMEFYQDLVKAYGTAGAILEGRVPGELSWSQSLIDLTWIFPRLRQSKKVKRLTLGELDDMMRGRKFN